MQQVKVHDKYFSPSITQAEIQEAVRQMAEKMNADLGGKTPLFLVILNGAFIFAADLVRNFRSDCEVTFVKLSSYSGTQSTHQVKKLIGLGEELKGRSVVIVEDIIDTGLTLDHLLTEVSELCPAEIRIATLLLKPDALQKDLHIDYVGMEIPNDFIIGYGLDYNGLARNYPEIYKIDAAPRHALLNLVLFGPPGAGKGTQALQIAQKFNLVHISTGDIFRREIRNQTPLGLSAKDYIDRGLLVPDEILMEMLKNVLENNPQAEGFLFDGFPRTLVQASGFDEMLQQRNTSVSLVISLEVNNGELTSRLLRRALEEGRTDDREEIINARLEVYHSQTRPLEKFYLDKGIFRTVNGEGTISEISDRISRAVLEYLDQNR